MDNDNKRSRGLIARRVAVFAGVLAVMTVGLTGNAFATGDTGDLFTGATTSITTTLIPAVVALILAGTLVWMGVAWFKKAKNKAGS